VTGSGWSLYDPVRVYKDESMAYSNVRAEELCV